MIDDHFNFNSARFCFVALTLPCGRQRLPTTSARRLLSAHISDHMQLLQTHTHTHEGLYVKYACEHSDTLHRDKQKQLGSGKISQNSSVLTYQPAFTLTALTALHRHRSEIREMFGLGMRTANMQMGHVWETCSLRKTNHEQWVEERSNVVLPLLRLSESINNDQPKERKFVFAGK